MLDLTKEEKLILIFLSLTFVVGLGIKSYKKSQPPELSVKSDTAQRQEKADRFTGQYGLVNINSFKMSELTRLPGVGEKIAAKIIEYHRANGPFRSKEELMRVEGIGGKKFGKIKDLIVAADERN